MEKNTKRSYWLTDEGQSELLRRIDLESRPPNQRTPAAAKSWEDKQGVERATLDPLDYTEKTKSEMKGCLSPISDDSEWIEIELTADSGACDTVIPREMAKGIPTVPSLQSLRQMEYEVANGAAIPNLGEKRVLIWTEGAGCARRMNMQVADAHKGLLSLSRTADMGFLSQLGRLAGALIDETTEEVIPLIRRGNLYILRAWIKAAPFQRPE